MFSEEDPNLCACFFLLLIRNVSLFLFSLAELVGNEVSVQVIPDGYGSDLQ